MGFLMLEKEVIVKERVGARIKPVVLDYSQKHQHRLIKNTYTHTVTELNVDVHRHN